MMRNKGASGFAIIFLILILFVIGYLGYQVARIHIVNRSMDEMINTVVEIGPAQSDHEIVVRILTKAKEIKLELSPDAVVIDRSITDSFRIYVAYRDSSSIFDIYYYTRDFVIDKIAPVKY